MTDSEPGMDFNFNQVLKSVQAIEFKTIQAAHQLTTAKSNLEEIKKELAAALVECDNEDFKTSQYSKEISLLEEKMPRQKTSIEALTKQIEDIRVRTEDVKWAQTKAKLVLESEVARRRMLQRIMDKRVAEVAPKTEPEIEDKNGSQISTAGAERARWKEELGKRQEFLQTEISKMEKTLEEKMKRVSDMGSEASVLKNRNSAVMLRLRRMLQESESRRLGLMNSVEKFREMAKRARPPF